MHVVSVQAHPQQFRLTEDFLAPYRVKGDPFQTLLARSTYLTKYSRDETWSDTIRRVVEGNMSLVSNPNQTEAEMLYHLFWTGQALPPGRSLWVGGVEGIPADARYNCFAPETRFWANGTLVSFAEAAGQTVEVLAKDGQWRPAEVRSFGKQKLYKYLLKPTGLRTNFAFEFTATAEHRWFTSNRGEVTDLRVGDRVLVEPASVDISTLAYQDGFAHGFVFGDGSRETLKPGFYKARLCGEKDWQHKDRLKTASFYHNECSPPSYHGDPVLFFKCARNLKELPPDDLGLPYLAGFLAGWMAADGSNRADGRGGNRLSSQNADALEWAKDRAPLLGFCVTGHSYDPCLETAFGVRAAPLGVMTLTQIPTEYTVKAVTDEGREEEVFCVTEPVTGSFTLAGGVVTGNCWYVTLRDVDDWCWAANQLMLGGGVGVGLGEIDSLPKVADHSSRLAIWCRADHENVPEVTPDDKTFLNGQTPVFVVPDSREGWVEALRQGLRAAFEGKDLIIDVSQVRPRGRPIRTFGGVACGPGPLSHMLRNTWRIIRGARGRSMSSVECLDVTNHIGLAVKSGNVRRSALIALGDASDQHFRNAKKDWEAVKSHRHTSNNSIAFRTWDEIHNFDWQSLVDDVVEFGEPGILNLPLVWRTDPGAEGVNPCGEQSLHNRESCNLAEIFPGNFESTTDPDLPFKLVTRYTLRQRLTPLSDPLSHDVGMRNMRVGVSLGGICDFDWTPAQLSRWFGVCRMTGDDYAEELGVARPITTTTVKPSGCRPWYALTATTRGLLTLEELFEDHPEGVQWSELKESVYAIQDAGSSRITKTYDNGTATVLRIRMSCGLEVESTENHQWWALGHHKHVLQEDARWVRADQLRVGDVLDVRVGLYHGGGPEQLQHLDRLSIRMRGDASPIRQPAMLNPDLSWFFGYLWGDGAQSPAKYRIRFIDQHEDNLRKAARILLEQFGVESEIHPASEGRRASVLEVASKMLWHWLIKNDVYKYFAGGLDLIPRVVRASGREEIIAFVAGLLDADGGAYGDSGKVKYAITTADPGFARHLQSVCWSVGLGLGRSHNTEGECYQKKRNMWLLTSNHFQDDDALTKLCQHSVKCAKMPHDHWYARNQKAPRRVPGKVEAIEVIGEMPTYDIEVENTHWYYAGCVKSHNTISLLNGSSPGIHAPHAPFYIRRVRIAKNDQMVPAMLEAGVPYEPDVYDKTGNTLVFEFPMKARHTKVTVQNQTLRGQFERQAIVQEYWADNAVSSTLSFSSDEKSALAGCLEEFVPRLKSTSMLAKAHGYEQAPYEEIDETTYRMRAATIQHDHPLVHGGEMDDGGECAGGSCPLR